MCHKRQKSPTAEAVGDSGLNIKVYPNVLPFVNSAFNAHAVQKRFRILGGHSEGSELPVNAQFPQSLIAA